MIMKAGKEVDRTSPLPSREQLRFEKQHVYFNGRHTFSG
jgi:hypothetical protein